MFEINAASKKKRSEGKKPKPKKLGRKQRAQLSFDKRKRKREQVQQKWRKHDDEDYNDDSIFDNDDDDATLASSSEEEEVEQFMAQAGDQKRLKRDTKKRAGEDNAKTDLSSAFRSVFTAVSKKSSTASSESSIGKPMKKVENFHKVGINQLLIRGPENTKRIASNDNSKGLTKLQLKFQKKLEGARFRALNEQLYSTRGEESFSNFQDDPSLFEIYHEGFREQVKSWPINPLDMIIEWINRHHSNKIVADMGCGDAQLALRVKNRVHSFDLVSVNERVTACDISNLPLRNESVDIVVFCLSLMGTNIGEFLRETHRVLKRGGYLKIAEVRSRFEGEKDGIKKFMRTLKKAGFDCVEKKFENKMFFMLECMKSARAPIFDVDYSAKVCHYKKR